MTKFTAVLAALLMMAITVPAYAGIDEGDWEVRLSGSAQFEDSLDTWAVRTQLGYFMTTEIEVGAEVGFAALNPSHADTSTAWEVNIFGAYNYEIDKNWTAYAGAFAGLYDFRSPNMDTIDSFHFGMFIGAKYFISEKTNIFIEYRFDYRTADEFSDNDSEFGHGMNVGFAILF